MSQQRIVSLDQFRGYTVWGMLLVNFIGGFSAVAGVFKHHHDHLSYADTIMPQFLFAVGFAFRLTFERRVEKEGAGAAYRRMVRRLLGLVLLSLVIYTVPPVARSWDQLREIGVWGAIKDPLKRHWFQTLMHIAVTSLWILPVIRRGAMVRILFMLASAALHVYLSWLFNFEWTVTAPNAIDGGPLGFLTWTIPAIVGTLACDVVVNRQGWARVAGMLAGSLLLMGLGWGMSCGTRLYDVPPDRSDSVRGQRIAEHPVIPPASAWQGRDWQTDWRDLLAEPPFVPPPDETHRQWNYWMMSQRAGTLSYLTFSAGFALLVYAMFYVAFDMLGWQLGLLRTFGTNALVAYVLHDLVAEAVKPFMSRDAPLWYVGAGLAVFFVVTWVMVRALEKQGVYVRM
jgi:predicted acyltransferase